MVHGSAISMGGNNPNADAISVRGEKYKMGELDVASLSLLHERSCP